MKIKYNPAVDLCCALLQYAHWTELAGTRIPGYCVSPELEAWYIKTKKNIPAILDNDINYLIKNFLGLIFLPVEFALTEDIKTAEELIKAFQALSPDTLPERMFSTYAADVSFDSIKDDPASIIAVIEKAGGTTRKKEPEFFLEFCRRPEVFKDRLSGIMDGFYKLAILPYEAQVSRTIDTLIKEQQELLDFDPNSFFSDYFRITRTESDAEPEILISYYDEIDIIQLDSPLSIIYGRSRNQLKNTSELPLEQIYSLLSDVSRRSVLRLLCRKAWFIRELADELELTSATISYHMSRLSALNLVTYERGERKRIYYRADMAKVQMMLDTVNHDIMGE